MHDQTEMAASALFGARPCLHARCEGADLGAPIVRRRPGDGLSLRYGRGTKAWRCHTRGQGVGGGPLAGDPGRAATGTPHRRRAGRRHRQHRRAIGADCGSQRPGGAGRARDPCPGGRPRARSCLCRRADRRGGDRTPPPTSEPYRHGGSAGARCTRHEQPGTVRGRHAPRIIPGRARRRDRRDHCARGVTADVVWRRS